MKRRAPLPIATLLALSLTAMAPTAAQAQAAGPCDWNALFLGPSGVGLTIAHGADGWTLRRLGEPLYAWTQAELELTHQTTRRLDRDNTTTLLLDVGSPCATLRPVGDTGATLTVLYSPDPLFVSGPACDERIVRAGAEATLCAAPGVALLGAPQEARERLDGRWRSARGDIHLVNASAPSGIVVDVSALGLDGRLAGDARAGAGLATLTRLTQALGELTQARKDLDAHVDADTLAQLTRVANATAAALEPALRDGAALRAQHEAAIERLVRERVRANLTAWYAADATCASRTLPADTREFHLCMRLGQTEPRSTGPVPPGGLQVTTGAPVDPSLLWPDLPRDLRVAPRPLFLSIGADTTVLVAPDAPLTAVAWIVEAAAEARSAREALAQAHGASETDVLAALDAAAHAQARLRALLDEHADTPSSALTRLALDEEDASRAATEAMRPALVRARVALWSTLGGGLAIALVAGLVTMRRLDARQQDLLAFRAQTTRDTRRLAWALLVAGGLLASVGIGLAWGMGLDLPGYLWGGP